MSFVRIAGIGSYAPEKVLSNHDLEKIVDTSDEWISTRTGIKERRIAAGNEASSDMALAASKSALAAANVSPSEIDVIVVATVTPDYLFPSTGCIIQSKLKAKNAYSFDILAGCSGFLYALHIGRDMIDCGRAKTVLAVGAESLSKVVDYEDRSTCVLFGDGSGAAVLRKSDTPGILSSLMCSDGDNWNLLYMPGGGSRIPASEQSVKNREHFLKMEGNEVFKVAVKAMETASDKAMELAGVKPSDIDLFIPHQANLRIIEAIRKRMDMPEEKVSVNLDRYGNTSSASIPIALHEAIKEGRVSEGSTLLLAAFGAGFTWGSCVVRL
ncbi:MAG: beta-ketoacyl-ACP synthase III [Thermodesulfobacteriota bacterium]